MTTLAEKIAVMQAFADGKKIQCMYRRNLPLTWNNFNGSTPSWNWGEYDYRIKPENIKYRRYLYNVSGKNDTRVACLMDLDSATVEKYDSFIRWIDTTWQEEEV